MQSTTEVESLSSRRQNAKTPAESEAFCRSVSHALILNQK